jgi:diguanylate cyclase (GGDEF)-like protein
MVSRRLEEVTGGGNVYRYGGEEFVVLFPGKYVDESFPHLERVRKSIEENPFRIRIGDRRRAKSRGKRKGGKKSSGREATVTVSIGVAGTADCRREPDLMVRIADEALYRAKSCGRNCTMIGDPELVKV